MKSRHSILRSTRGHENAFRLFYAVIHEFLWEILSWRMRKILSCSMTWAWRTLKMFSSQYVQLFQRIRCLHNEFMFKSYLRIIAKKPQNSLNSSKSLLFNFTEKILPSAIMKSLSRETKTSNVPLVDSLSPSKASSSIKTKRCSPDTNAQFVGPRIAGSCSTMCCYNKNLITV